MTTLEFNSKTGHDDAEAGNDVEVWCDDIREWWWSSTFTRPQKYGPFETEATAIAAARAMGPTLWPDRTLLGRLRWWWGNRRRRRELEWAERVVKMQRAKYLAKSFEDTGRSPREWDSR